MTPKDLRVHAHATKKESAGDNCEAGVTSKYQELMTTETTIGDDDSIRVDQGGEKISWKKGAQKNCEPDVTDKYQKLMKTESTSETKKAKS